MDEKGRKVIGLRLIGKGHRPTLGSERQEPQTGHPSSGDLHRGDEPPCLVGSCLGITGLQETWTLLTKREWGEDTGWTVRWEDSCRGCQVPKPREHSNPAHSTWQHGWDLGLQRLERKPIYGTQNGSWSQERVFAQAAHQKSLYHSSCPRYAERVHTSPTCPTVRLHSKAEVADANSSSQLWGTKET